MAWVFITAIFISSFVFSIKEIDKRTDHNEPIKLLSQRNKDLSNLAVYGIAYEAPLFYFDTGNIKRDTKRADYVLTVKVKAADLRKEFGIKDTQDNYLLLIKK